MSSLTPEMIEGSLNTLRAIAEERTKRENEEKKEKEEKLTTLEEIIKELKDIQQQGRNIVAEIAKSRMTLKRKKLSRMEIDHWTQYLEFCLDSKKELEEEIKIITNKCNYLCRHKN